LNDGNPEIIFSKREYMDDYPLSYHCPPIHVKHAELERLNDESMFRSRCPQCKEGMLMVRRDQTTLALLPLDNCCLCGQHYIYDDIDSLRWMEGDYQATLNAEINLTPQAPEES
jgi:hypothetical protein